MERTIQQTERALSGISHHPLRLELEWQTRIAEKGERPTQVGSSHWLLDLGSTVPALFTSTHAKLSARHQSVRYTHIHTHTHTHTHTPISWLPRTNDLVV